MYVPQQNRFWPYLDLRGGRERGDVFQNVDLRRLRKKFVWQRKCGEYIADQGTSFLLNAFRILINFQEEGSIQLLVCKLIFKHGIIPMLFHVKTFKIFYF